MRLEGERETAICFTDDQLDEILEWMDDAGSETVQDAIMQAIARAKEAGE